MPVPATLSLAALLALDAPTCPEGQRPFTGGCAEAETGLGAVCFVRPGRLMAAGVNMRIWETGLITEEGAPLRLMGDSELDPDELAHLATGNQFCFLTTEGVHTYAAAPLLQKGMGALIPVATLIANPKVPIGKASARVYPGQVTVIEASLEPGATSGGTPKLKPSSVSVFDEQLFDPEQARRLAPWLVPAPELEAWIKATQQDDAEQGD